MNNRESLSHLVEIQYLIREKDTLLSRMQNENGRISALQKRQKDAFANIENLEEENKKMSLKEKELTLSSLESMVEKLQSQLTMASNEKEANAIAETLKNKINEKENLEEIVFGLLEREEVNNLEIKNLKNFLNGLEDSIAEITLEVEKNTQEEKSKLHNTENRLKSLTVELSKDTLTIFERALQKHPKNPLSYIAGLACKDCQMQLNSVLKTQVENMSSIESCPYCERILLPTNLNY